MKAALFIPCYVDAFFPEVGIATLELLERLGVEVAYPLDQTCCGQPMANSGCHEDAAATEALFVRNFAGFDYIVTPSGSCTHHVRENLTAIAQTADTVKVRQRTYELVEFVHDVLQVREFPWAEFPHAVGLHNGCASLRALNRTRFSAPRRSQWAQNRRSRASTPHIMPESLTDAALRVTRCGSLW